MKVDEAVGCGALGEAKKEVQLHSDWLQRSCRSAAARSRELRKTDFNERPFLGHFSV